MWVATYLMELEQRVSSAEFIIMWSLILILLLVHCYGETVENEEPIRYYYGIEESERELPLCSERQACSALLQRYWRQPALIRLCRCTRRTLCDTPAPALYRIPLNNRADFQFCQPVTDWPDCSVNDVPVTIEKKRNDLDNMNPDELERIHHRDLQLTAPKITFKCRCREPNYWKFNATTNYDDVQTYRCASMPICKTDDFCGNVSHDLYALYQSCQCPRHHVCAHNGGITHLEISEILYRGKGWRAYCQRVTDDYSYEDYYEH